MFIYANVVRYDLNIKRFLILQYLECGMQVDRFSNQTRTALTLTKEKLG